ncbi:hypothetical protein B0T19DRAFT_397740 [Cercophora scortea]|uniref:Glycosyl transferase CAP10 domain-containing protein n=1 Tax=Cercophora scortea TaxID=314031 RepID=A0AAE0IVN8_9PEZI|nr:hypothetical protein B0T19DRAFT_397740 [Cercophora scortea]
MGDIRLKKTLRRQSRQIRQITLVLGFCLVCYCLLFVSQSPTTTITLPLSDDDGDKVGAPRSRRPRLSSKILDNLSLDEGECNAAFPGLTKEIDDIVAVGPFKVKNMGDFGPLQGRIKDGQIHILHSQRKRDLSQEMLNSRTAALHQLHRALITSPSPLPDTIFSLNFQDQPFGTALTYSRQADASFRPKDANSRFFLMPHFSFWAWPLPFIGSLPRAAAAITALESAYLTSTAWQQNKISKAVWRGTSWYNSVHSPRLRQKLLAAAKGQPWADVQALEWQGGHNATNALPIEDFCKYKYVVHTEGVTYSGRFQFLQMCASVVLTPPIQWMQHTTHLVRPLFSSSLDLEPGPHVDGTRQSSGASSARTHAKAKKTAGSGSASSAPASAPAGPGQERRGWVPSERIRKAWPVQYEPDEANIVFVAPDWSDLGDTVAWLEAHPKVAEGIARRQRELFVGGGYFSPAAEACYWRALVRGWAKMARVDEEEWAGTEGVTFEAFALSNGD